MKKAFLLLLMIVFIVGLLVGKTLPYSFQFEQPNLEKSGKYVKVLYKNCINHAQENYPLLPHYDVNILLPNGEKIKDVKIKSIEYYKPIENVTIQPASKQFPISKPASKDYKPFPDERIYSLHNYPSSNVMNYLTGYLAGHSIASIDIVPIKYMPSENKILPIKNIKLEVITEKDNYNAKALYKENEQIKNRIKKIVINEQDYSRYYPKKDSKDRDNSIDILLITGQSLLSSFDNFIAYKNSIGFITVTRTVQDIYNNYDGRDNQEKIRNCIIDYYQNYDIKYVILGGDADGGNTSQNIVPARGLTVIIGSSDYDEHNLPSDMYYSNLDGTWNNDNDSDWGENGEIDFYSEISVGRICADQPQEVLNFTNKIIKYENQPVNADIKKALMLGEILDDTPTYGGNYKDEIADGSDNNGYHTVPLPISYEITKFYERDADWNKNNVFSQFNNQGVHLLNHLGHSSPSYNMKMENTDLTVQNFTNDGETRSYVIGYSQGCYNGSFDNWIWNGYYLQDDCFAENITDLETGEVAAIANSRYGWYSPGATNSSSQYYDRQFFNTIFDDNITIIGRTNSFAKEKDVMLIMNNMLMRWSAFETNLFGDPSMDIWTDVPQDFEMVSLPETIDIGSTSMELIMSETNARISVLKNDELIGRVDSNQSAIVDIVFNSAIDEICQLTVVITAHNKNKYVGTVNVVPNDTAFLSPVEMNFSEIVGVANNVADHGERLGLYFTVKNFGTVDASDVFISLNNSDEYYSIVNASAGIGEIPAGTQSQNTEPIIIDISRLCPSSGQIMLNVHMTATQGEWDAVKILQIKSPVLNLETYSYASEQSSYLIPGDSGVLNVTINNSGEGLAYKPSVKVLCNDEHITLNNNLISEEQILPGESIAFSEAISFDISEDCPDIYQTYLTVEMSDSLGYYNVDQIPLKIGYLETVENGIGEWTHYSINQNVDQWHISESNYHSSSHSWKMGSNGGQNYFNNLKCALESPEIYVQNSNFLTFYHKMSAETSQQEGNCYDGGLVEIYFNGSWQTLIPINGYPYTSIGNNNPPFSNGTGLFSGNINWQKEFFSLQGFEGNVKFRFVFGSDGAVSSEGWYIDDIAITSTIDNVVPPTQLSVEDLGDAAYKLTWNYNEDDDVSFNVYKKLGDQENYSLISNTENHYYEGTFEEINDYYWVVTTVKNNVESEYSNFVYYHSEYSDSHNDVIVSKIVLLQNYPNPFNPETKLSFYINENGKTNLTIYNLKGEKVKTIVNDNLSKGYHTYIWNGVNNNGKPVSSGVYFYKLVSKDKVRIKKMLMLK